MRELSLDEMDKVTGGTGQTTNPVAGIPLYFVDGIPPVDMAENSSPDKTKNDPFDGQNSLAASIRPKNRRI